MKYDTVRWGIIGPGAIARKFAEGLRVIPDAKLTACASREKERAEAFGKEFGAARRYGSYAEMVRDDEVDAVYVATPHPFHREHTLLCLDAGKAVLCEKPFAMNVHEAEAMIARAREKKVFLMEAMWTRFLPHIREAKRLADAGRIGDPRLWRADFCFRAGWDPESRLLNPALGGGGLLDVGVYTLHHAFLFLGPALEVRASADIGKTGVDEAMAFSTRHDGGRLASMTCAVRLNLPHAAALYGTDGHIAVNELWWQPSGLKVTAGGKTEEVVPEAVGNGYNYEAVEVARCLREGLLESPHLPWSETMAVMRAMDDVRKQIGLKYPADAR